MSDRFKIGSSDKMYLTMQEPIALSNGFYCVNDFVYSVDDE